MEVVTTNPAKINISGCSGLAGSGGIIINMIGIGPLKKVNRRFLRVGNGFATSHYMAEAGFCSKQPCFISPVFCKFKSPCISILMKKIEMRII